ncbi:hypothetical protein FS837_005890, partial [Tulasnella sp. UAMH 9824]
GDVTAFYPNVDVELARNIVLDKLSSTLWNHSDGEVKLLTPEERLFLEKLWDVANGSLIFRFQDQIYAQERGLAMGVASSPSVANLYGAYFEEKVLPQLSGVTLYVRYIDDVFPVVQARDKEEARRIMEPLKFPGCEIVWEAEEAVDGVVFLDMEIKMDPVSRRIDYWPYRKPRNSFERIPYASHHPDDVKRGTFIGELSRMADLSSRRAYFDEACQELKDIYLARGYPARLVDTWLTNNANERWKSRLSARTRHSQPVHVLKTVFNPVWDFVSAKDLQSVIMEHWSQVIDEAKEGGDPGLPLDRTESRHEDGQIDYYGMPRSVGRAGHLVWGGGPLLPPVEDEQLVLHKKATIHHRSLIAEGSAALGHVRQLSKSPDLPSEGPQEQLAPQVVPISPVTAGRPVEDGEVVEYDDSILNLLDRRFIFSRRRTRVLGDLVNDWRRTTLAYTESRSAFPLDERQMRRWTDTIDKFGA